MDCVFCDRIDNGDYIDVDYEVARFVPLNPVSAGHVLFVPKKHLSDATCDPWTTARVMARAAEWADKRWQAGDHANLITSIGPHATQTIRHLHVHYVPRREGDGLLLPWSNQDGDQSDG